MTSAEHEHDTTDPLRMDRCPDCGYLLTGLPERGVCPECGSAYDEQMIVLYGWGCGDRLSLANSHGWRRVMLGALLLPQMIMMLILAAAAAMFQSLGWLWLIPWILAVAYFMWRWRRIRRDAPAPSQVRLCPQGYAQRDGLGPVTLQPWRRGVVMQLTPAGRGRYRIRRQVRFLSMPVGPLGKIGLEFECDATKAESIGKRMQAWYWSAPGTADI
jgi:hypothetical protein